MLLLLCLLSSQLHLPLASSTSSWQVLMLSLTVSKLPLSLSKLPSSGIKSPISLEQLPFSLEQLPFSLSKHPISPGQQMLIILGWLLVSLGQLVLPSSDKLPLSLSELHISLSKLPFSLNTLRQVDGGGSSCTQALALLVLCPDSLTPRCLSVRHLPQPSMFHTWSPGSLLTMLGLGLNSPYR